MTINKIMLHEVEDIGAWNNFKSICYVLDDLRDDIKKLSHDFKEQQRQLLMIYKGLEGRLEEREHGQLPDIELPNWMRKDPMKM